MSLTLEKSKGRTSKKNSYAGIPRLVMESEDYKNLSGSAVKLLNEFCYQFRGGNNGNLTCAFSVLKDRGWKSRATIEKARDELLKANLVVQTREGRFLNPGGVCALYGLTWFAIDPAPGRVLDFGPTTTPPRKWNEF